MLRTARENRNCTKACPDLSSSAHMSQMVSFTCSYLRTFFFCPLLCLCDNKERKPSPSSGVVHEHAKFSLRCCDTLLKKLEKYFSVPGRFYYLVCSVAQKTAYISHSSSTFFPAHLTPEALQILTLSLREPPSDVINSWPEQKLSPLISLSPHPLPSFSIKSSQ